MIRHLHTSRILFIIMAITLLSCKKDNEGDDDSNYMVGNLSFTLSQYLTTGQEIRLSATGITEPEEGLVYQWYTTGFSVDSLTGQDITLFAPTEIGNYSVSLKVTHSDYVTKSQIKSVIVINPALEESYSGVINGPYSLIDERDGNIYHYKQIGNLFWFTSNLQFEGAGNPYNRELALSPIFGVLYTWNEATGGVTANGLGKGPTGVCPAGWSVPTNEDWEDLAIALNGSPIDFEKEWKGVGEKLAANARINGSNIWKYSPNNLKNNTSEWNALPGGSTSNKYKSFSNINQYGFWWSSTQKDLSKSYYRYIHFDLPDFPYNYSDKEYFGASVRCVRLIEKSN